MLLPIFSLRVLGLYAWNRIAYIIDRDDAIYQEIQRRANLVPLANRQTAIDAMVKNRLSLTKEALLHKRAAEKAEKKNYILVYLFLLLVAVMAYLSCSGGIH